MHKCSLRGDFSTDYGQGRTTVHRFLDLLANIIGCLLGGERCKRGRRVDRVAGFELRHACLVFFKECFVNSLYDDYALGSAAHLTSVPVPAKHRPLSRLVQIGVVEHHESIGAAKLQCRLLQDLARLGRHNGAGIFRAGQGHAMNAGALMMVSSCCRVA